MSMTEQQINVFLDRDEQLLRDGLIDETQPNVNLMGMSDEEIANKYGFVPSSVVFDNIMKKLEDRGKHK